MPLSAGTNPDAESGPGDIYVINADGTGERNLTDSPTDESDPAWAPKTQRPMDGS
jgi:Tol biopolymer transport system component